MKILICDSEPWSRNAIEQHLRMAGGSEVTACLWGAEVLEQLEHEPFDLLLLDTDLPLLDGFETLGLIRQVEQLRTLPVVLISHDRSVDTVLRGRMLSVFDYVLKPVSARRLDRALRAAAAHALRTAQMPTAASASADIRPRTLVVDGDAGFRNLLRTLLEPHCIVATAATGSGALNEAWVSRPTLAFIGRDLGPIGPAPLVRCLTRLGASGLVKVATPDEITAESATGLYAGVVGRSDDPGVVLHDIGRFIRLPARPGQGALHQLLDDVPVLHDAIVQTMGAMFESRLSRELEVREAGERDVLGAHALMTMTIAHVSLRLSIQSTTDLIRQLAATGPDASADLRSSVGVLADAAAQVAEALQRAAGESGLSCTAGTPWFAPGASAREGLPADAERLVVELAPRGTDGRFRVVIDAYSGGAVPSDAAGDERLSA